MNSADLKERINIYELTVTTTEFGDTHDEYSFKYSCRVRVNYSTGSRTVDNDAIFYSEDREFIVRSYVPIKNTDIIEWDNFLWQVLSIDKNKTYNDIIIRTTKIQGDNTPIINR